MNGIQILITGSAASGKTTISQEIVDALRNLGFAVKWGVKPDYKSEQDARYTGIDRLKRLDAVSDKTTIVVREITAKKDINSSLNYRVDQYIKPKE